MFCSHCGKALAAEDNFCSHCGKACRSDTAVVYRFAATAVQKPGGKLNLALFLRGIFALLGLVAPGVVAILYTLRAAKADSYEEEQRCLKIAKIAVRVGIAILALAVALGLFFLFRYVITSLMDILEGAGYPLGGLVC